MTLTALLLFAATEFFLSLSPGPAVFLVVSQGLQRGKGASFLGALGILSGNAIYFGLSSVGVGTILLASELAFLTIKWVGAVYLGYLGVRLIYDSIFVPTADVEKALPEVQKLTMFRQGLTMQLANPQAILFFVAILPQFVSVESAPVRQLLILGVISILLEFPILLGYGWLADKSGKILKESRFFKWLDRLAGVFLIGAGLKLALFNQE
ncbi:MAG: LysE family translocator [Anaerolineae bacterium]